MANFALTIRSRRFIARGFFVASSLFLSPLAYAVTAPVGATPGSFAVNEHGGATYTIPIAAPPGTAGVTPQIALRYDKQVQSDLVGVGWSIGGMSIITRCGTTIAIDGVKGGVNFDSNDRFCLDGQRLINISGAYGADGTEYRTERESFAKIFSYRDAAFTGSGPQSFRVFAPNGLVSEYGANPDSRIEAQGKTTVRLWALNTVQDIKSNYFTISYAEDNINGEYRPLQIDYTGNANIGLTPYNSIRFLYGPRTDIIPGYQAGSVIKTTQRLQTIQSFADLALTREYRLTYDNNGAANRSRLTSVRECGSDGVCLQPTNFAHQQANFGFAETLSSTPPLPLWDRAQNDNHGTALVDVNGDGLVDLVRNVLGIEDIAHQGAWLNTGSGWVEAPAFSPPAALWDRVPKVLGRNSDTHGTALIDVNGDGLVDLVRNVLGIEGIAHQGAWLNAASKPNLFVSVSNGLGNQTTVSHKPLTSSSAYSKDSISVYPYQDIQNATYVVSRVTRSDGIGGTRNYSYRYAGAKVHWEAALWLGFRRIQVTNDVSGVTATTEYNQIYDGTQGLINYTDVVANNKVVKSTQHFWRPVSFTTGKQIFARLDGTLEQTFELSQPPTAAAVTRINADYLYDSFGNRTSVSINYNDGNTKTTANTYTNDTVNWILGQLTRTEVTRTDNTTVPSSSQTRVSTFTYETGTGLLSTTTTEPNAGPDITLTTSYSYDSFGNKVSATVGGPSVVSRTTTDTYDTRGQFVISQHQCLGPCGDQGV